MNRVQFVLPCKLTYLGWFRVKYVNMRLAHLLIVSKRDINIVKAGPATLTQTHLYLEIFQMGFINILKSAS